MSKFDDMLESAFREHAEAEQAAAPDRDTLRDLYPGNEDELGELLCTAEKKHDRKRFIRRAGRSAAAIVLASAVIFGVLMTDSEIRAAVKRAAVSFYESFVRIDIAPDKPDTPDKPEEELIDFTVYTVGHVPEEFTQISEEYHDHGRVVSYRSADGRQLQIRMTDSSRTTIYHDLSKYVMNVTSVGLYEAFLFTDPEGKSYCSLVWAVKDVQFKVAGAITPETAMRIAENIGKKSAE